MPNWCDNELRISGETIRVKECLAAIGDDLNAIDFNRIIPMPSVLEATNAPTEWWVEYLIGSQTEEYLHGHLQRTLDAAGIRDEKCQEAFFAQQDASARLTELVKGQHPEWEQSCRAVQRSINESGSSNWYDWKVKNWGTKWEADSDEANLEERVSAGTATATIRFFTAWSPPTPVIKAIGERFPDLEVSLVYYESGMGFHGVFELVNGEVDRDECGPYFGDRRG